MKNYSASFSIDVENVKRFLAAKSISELDDRERGIVLNAIFEKVAKKNGRHNSFNFSYQNSEIYLGYTDNETRIDLPKCLSHVTFCETDGALKALFVFRSMNFDKNFEFDMGTVYLACIQAEENLGKKIESLVIHIADLHSERKNFKLKEVEKKLGL